jgi:hypothetical protein
MSQPMTMTQWYTRHQQRHTASAPHAMPAPMPGTRTGWRVVPATVAPVPATPRQPAFMAHAGIEPATLGSARAGGVWGWAEPAAPLRAESRSTTVADRTELPMAGDLLRAMARAAAEAGVSEAAVWAEAARMWLAVRHSDDDPRPPTPGAAAPRSRQGEAARERCWSAIDVVLRDLRAPLPLAA